MLIGLSVVLRPVFTSNSAILLRSGTMEVAAPLLTALPVLAMAIASAFAGRLLLGRGIRWVVLTSGFALVIGAGVRLGGDMLSVIAGSCFAACAIGALNVSLPLLARTLFPGQLALATSLYTAALYGGAAGGAALTAALVDGGSAVPFAAPLIAGLALVGLQFAPHSLLLPLALVQGIAQGALIALAMFFIAARPLSEGEIAILSARVQGCGYAAAAAGPQILGVLLARQSLFAMPFLLVLSMAAAVAAIFAQRSLALGSGGSVDVNHRVSGDGDEGTVTEAI